MRTAINPIPARLTSLAPLTLCLLRMYECRAFARQCVLSLQEGARATLTLQPESGKAPSAKKAIDVQLVLSTDGLRLLWTPEPGSANAATPSSGFVRTTDIRSVAYDGASAVARPDEDSRAAATRFSIVTPFDTLSFASAFHLARTCARASQFALIITVGLAVSDPLKLEHFVCGLRHLARRPLERRSFLWQRTAAINKELVDANSFDKRLGSLAAFLQKQKTALEQLGVKDTS